MEPDDAFVQSGFEQTQPRGSRLTEGFLRCLIAENALHVQLFVIHCVIVKCDV